MRGVREVGPYIMCHPDRGNKTEWRDLQKRKKRFWRYVYAKLFPCKMLLIVHWSATLLIRSRNGVKRLAPRSLGHALASRGSTS